MDDFNVTEAKKGFYESKGYVRHMVILPVEYKERLKSIAKKYKVTQGEVVEEMLNIFDKTELPNVLEERRAAKTSGRTTKTELLKRMKGLSQDQIEAIEAIINK